MFFGFELAFYWCNTKKCERASFQQSKTCNWISKGEWCCWSPNEAQGKIQGSCDYLRLFEEGHTLFC